ncbi:hypothetical protein SRABI102_02787 [Stenotrophomonas lactitubi]|nr:hypothetical protein SRABI66_01489 [Stenotrophomonas lactitubi]CAH0201806.1 hypothetical protein SRABI122_01935 [Stenotrophomonas lactitubi]CAH0230434.1 hypothetical protein SRABI81_02675 [Stenotrophomonas lactitubi]CAH0241401.1 hypothetical protein SRABI102_02787 [Stenotrophomonas lactitubi]
MTAATPRIFRAATPPDRQRVPLPRAEQLIDLLLARQQRPPILEKNTGLPYGWAIWLRTLTPLPRPLHAREVIAVLLPRPLPGSPGQLPALGPWASLRRLFWQDWDPAPRDQRWMHWTSALLSALLHLLFFLLLLWVAVIRTSSPDEQGSEGERVQIEFVGRAAQEGGGDQAGAEAAAAAAAGAGAAGQDAGGATAPRPQPASPAPSAATAAAAATSPTASVPPPPEVEPAPVAAPPPSPVQATEVAQATSDFVVPPMVPPRTEVSIVPRDTVPTVRERSVQPVQAAPTPTPVRTPEVAVQAPRVRDVQVQEREISTVEAPVAPQPMRTTDIQVRVPQREVQVREREVQAVTDPQVRMAAVAGREPTVRAPAGREVQVREREVAAAPLPAASTSAGSAPTSTPAPAGSAAQNSASVARPAATSTAPAQAGARPAPTPGNWATPARGDDWGASSRNREGANQGAAQASAGKGDGLFNADGSVRVTGQDGAGKAERGAPGGANDGWSKERIAESGKWLKRPPYDYTPTSFDKYWVPQESLLAEWVRKGVKAMEIPLPGTSTKISCVISILQAGGGCGLTDPNMQDQPAVARPPPDIPFKKELQEDNGSR